MQTRIEFIFILLLLFLLVLAGCSPEEQEPLEQAVSSQKVSELPQDKPLTEDRNVYLADEKTPIVDFYVTVRKDEDNLTTFYQLNHAPPENPEELKVKVIFQEGTAEGPRPDLFGYGEKLENGVLTTRGQTTRFSPQKSYKIKLMNRAGLWRNQEVINLNKHPFDATRIRNKLSFDYFRLIPDMTSLRTQFVHLHVKDETANPPETSFKSYGFYTQIEQANKRFLGAHGLDPNGYLYKPKFFEFYRSENELRDVTDPQYNKQAFESILEIKGREDHAKLITMLEDINHSTSDFDQVFDKHFDRDNYLTWVGLNILFGNIDTRTQNYYLYSPLNHPKWFFLPWDYDGAWGKYEDDPLRPKELADWEVGISNYWGNVLHKRFFKNPKNVEALTKKLEELRKIVHPEQTKKMIDQYYPIVSPLVKSSPDLDFLPIKQEHYDENYDRLPQMTEENYQKYLASLERPLPFFLGIPQKENGIWTFIWEASYDLQNDDLKYEFQISKDPGFQSIVSQAKDLLIPRHQIQELPPGTYYWRAIAQDSKGNRQVAFDILETEDGQLHYGVKEWKIRPSSPN